jgi:uncharacterized protein (TIGR02145 family)
MKQIKNLLFVFLLVAPVSAQAQVGIGNPTPAASAQLDVTSTTKGLLPPRMTITQRNAIAGPVAGLMIWCTNCVAPAGELEIYNGYSWTNMTGGTSPSGTVTICSQDWMTKNLDVATYRNGDPIPKVTDPTAWAALSTGAYCYYNNDSATNAAVYGKLYNWYAVNDSRGLAPAGWHIPSQAEWTLLETCLGGWEFAGGAMKETGTTHWVSPNTDATNSSGFTGLPGGVRSSNGSFNFLGTHGYWWSSTESNAGIAWDRYLVNTDGVSYGSVEDKKGGFSVRCIRD